MIKNFKLKKIVTILISIFLFTGCSNMDANEKLKRTETSEQNIETTDFKSESVSGEDNKITVTDATDNNDNVTAISTGVNLVSTKNMPIASDKLEYKGENMEYGAVLTNNNDYGVEYTFMIMVNGLPQPFTIKEDGRECNYKTYSMNAGEEKIVYFSFKPVEVHHDKDVLVSLIGVVVKKKISQSVAGAMMNSTVTDYNILMVANDAKYDIINDNKDNVVGNVIEKYNTTDKNTAGTCLLSDKKEDHISINKIRIDELKPENVKMYYASENSKNTRLYVLNNGKLLNTFNKKLYGDVKSDESAVYEIEIDKDEFDKNINKCCILSINMDYIDKGIKEGVEAIGGIAGLSYMQILSK